MKKDFNKNALSNVIRHLALAELRGHKEIKSDQTVTLLKRYFPVHVHKPSIIIQPVKLIDLPKPKISQIPKIPVTQRPALPITNVSVEVSPTISFGKLSSLMLDKSISLVECPGPNMPVQFKKNAEALLSNITLTDFEIQQIIESFSKESKTPISTVFKAATKGFVITAIVSTSGSRFIVSRINV